MPKFFVIYASNYPSYIYFITGLPLFWNNETGWGDLANATVFTDIETKELSLPIDGAEWLELPNTIWETFQGYQYAKDAQASALADDLLPF